MILILCCVIAFAFYFISMGLIRKRQYKYNPAQDYKYDFSSPIELADDVFIDLESYRSHQTIILSVQIQSRSSGHLFQPFIETISDNAKKQIHYLEHGLKGVRYIDISIYGGGQCQLIPHHCSIVPQSRRLFIFDEINIAEKTVLLLAPHADDAEIAAFGLYSSAKKSYIVTITAGEEGKCDYCGLFESKKDQLIHKGKLRVHDALSIPMLGGVTTEQCAMLGYFGKSLKWMYHNQDKTAISKSTGIENLDFFRRTEHTRFLSSDTKTANWDALVEDLYECILNIQPDIIVTVHPQIDSHSDHIYTTVALCEALDRATDTRPMTILTYTNHHIYNEAYPYGPIRSTSILAPKFKKSFVADGIYSFHLNSRQQNEKFYALEGMHDLRDSTIVLGVKKSWNHFTKQLKREIQQRDKSYFRRAIRPNELYYVLNRESLSIASNEFMIASGENFST